MLLESSFSWDVFVQEGGRLCDNNNIKLLLIKMCLKYKLHFRTRLSRQMKTHCMFPTELRTMVLFIYFLMQFNFPFVEILCSPIRGAQIGANGVISS